MNKICGIIALCIAVLLLAHFVYLTADTINNVNTQVLQGMSLSDFVKQYETTGGNSGDVYKYLYKVYTDALIPIFVYILLCAAAGLLLLTSHKNSLVIADLRDDLIDFEELDLDDLDELDEETLEEIESLEPETEKNS